MTRNCREWTLRPWPLLAITLAFSACDDRKAKPLEISATKRDQQKPYVAPTPSSNWPPQSTTPTYQQPWDTGLPTTGGLPPGSSGGIGSIGGIGGTPTTNPLGNTTFPSTNNTTISNPIPSTNFPSPMGPSSGPSGPSSAPIGGPSGLSNSTNPDVTAKLALDATGKINLTFSRDVNRVSYTLTPTASATSAVSLGAVHNIDYPVELSVQFEATVGSTAKTCTAKSVVTATEKTINRGDWTCR